MTLPSCTLATPPNIETLFLNVELRTSVMLFLYPAFNTAPRSVLSMLVKLESSIYSQPPSSIDMKLTELPERFVAVILVILTLDTNCVFCKFDDLIAI